MNTELYNQCQETLKRFRSLNIRPKMEVTITGGKPSGTFDLRSLNKVIIKNYR